MPEKNSNRNLMMVLGPTEIEDDVLLCGAMPVEYNRTAKYTEFLKSIFSNLAYVFQTENPVFVMSCSGTGAMECAVTNILSASDKILYINGGTFGKRWGDICRTHGVNALEIKLDFGETVDPEEIRKVLEANPDIKAVFTTQDETSTGALTDIEAVARVVRDFPAILVVDAVSSLLVEKMSMDAWGVDVLLTSSQKALALPPGLGFISFSPKAMKLAETASLRTLFFDVFEYLKDWKRNQTPYTPPISLLNQLSLRLEKIVAEGLDNVQQRYLENTLYLREKLAEIGLELASDNLANCVTGIWSPEGIKANEIVDTMSEKYHISVAPSPGDLKTKLFRVGNFGNINKEDINYFAESLQATIAELRHTDDK